MRMARFGLIAGAAALAFLLVAPATAQLADRTIEEIKAETLARAERGAYPVNGLDPADVREALAAIATRDPDDWARGFAAVAERYLGEGLVAARGARADASFLRAWRLYYFGQ